jgi:hypothetical protein
MDSPTVGTFISIIEKLFVIRYKLKVIIPD